MPSLAFSLSRAGLSQTIPVAVGQFEVVVGIDVVELHLLEGASVVDVFPEREELMVVRDQGQTLRHGLVCAATVPEMGSQTTER